MIASWVRGSKLSILPKISWMAMGSSWLHLFGVRALSQWVAGVDQSLRGRYSQGFTIG
ncbi:hypothetical protein JCM17844_18620 [Iodidimonas gelatinilytica]|uniref:Uncharacterized protein n=1 Tax=Iodidimonas gelatinilytica TaxID=1236966 RepID=A0A5A7MTC3_9PROT|nr:hypothetical protein JCM17844_18620 [Iodidimonas gelatinilytica]